LAINDLATDEPSNQTKYDPADNAHVRTSRFMKPWGNGPTLRPQAQAFSTIVQLTLQPSFVEDFRQRWLAQLSYDG
jgi:hypothetical protein